METVGEAERAGKTHLDVHCHTCRITKMIPWRLIAVTGDTRMDDLKRRLVCAQCGARPDPDTVTAWAQSDAPGYYRG
ncbi:hypothetical protein ABE438_14780 [Bosea sp. TWI1241]|uniref:hypothetical protein n=1 Tax=Bosea sp. TWI1241 TaxID=3148904 RepID=UPI00320BA844